MDTIAHYHDLVRRLIMEYAGYKPSHGQIETEAIIDPERGHYEVMHIGWDGVRRVHGTVIHIGSYSLDIDKRLSINCCLNCHTEHEE
jgi:hypothetical protein